MGIVLSLFNVYVLNYGIPLAESRFRDLEFEVKNSFTKMMLREGSFTVFKNNMTVFIDEFIDENTIRGILVSDSKKTFEKVITVAEAGKIEYTDVGPKILLKNGTRQVVDKKNLRFTAMRFDDYVVDFGDLSVARKKKEKVREKGIKELFREAKNPNIDIKERLSYRAEGHKRIISPFFNVLFALFACVGLLVANFNRRGQGKVITFSILMMITVQALDMCFYNMARKSEWVLYLMYLNCFLPLGIVSFVLVKTPRFGFKRLKSGDVK